MNLIIEQGNTSTKVALFQEGALVNTFVYKNFDRSVLAGLFDRYAPTDGILSTVTRPDLPLYAYLDEHLRRFIVLNEQVPVPLRIDYDTPETLGMDRLAAAAGAYGLQPGKPLLVIDAGTAITYELIEANGHYKGGNISPGMTTRFKALNLYTERLPLVSEQEEIPLIGTNTVAAIQAGVVQGIVYEMDGYINELRGKYPGLLVFLTGGHSFYFERRLKNRIFADVNLVLKGLNRILEYNVEN